MAAFLVPRAALLLPASTAAIVARLWEVEALRATSDVLL